MLTYFYEYYIAQMFGPGYVVTNIAWAVAVVLLLGGEERGARGALKKLGEMALCWLGMVAYGSVYRALLGHSPWMDRSMMLLLLVLYAVFRSKLNPATRIVRCCILYACTMLALTLSEPIGTWVESNINASYTWAEHFTWVVMVLLTTLVVMFLRRFSTEKLVFIPTFHVVIVAAVAALSLLLQQAGDWFQVPKGYKVLQAGCFWAILFVAYYMFYLVSREYQSKLELVAIQHRVELNEEMLQFSKESYEEMHQIRHETKNHLAYIRALAECGEYEKLKDYLNVVSGETEALFQFVECGNDVINAVMNHAIKQARANGVEVELQIIVPPELPYQETDLCSLLSNLMDNAIEGSICSGEEKPVISVGIRPQQDYLFLRVTNPVGEEGSGRPSLRTTKEDKRLHGYGTKIIRRVTERYEGSVNFRVQDKRFIADVMLSLEGEQNGKAAFGNL